MSELMVYHAGTQRFLTNLKVEPISTSCAVHLCYYYRTGRPSTAPMEQAWRRTANLHRTRANIPAYLRTRVPAYEYVIPSGGTTRLTLLV